MSKTTQAFTRIELMAVVAALVLLGVLALPLFAASRADSDRAACFNNLRQVGRAVGMWGAERDDLPPWITFVSRGGTRPDSGSKVGVAWFEFTALSNELVTPRILACPADTGVKVASEFSTASTRGYMATGMRAQATSYFINMDNLGRFPLMAVAGDRNVRTTSVGSCSQGPNNVDILQVLGPYTEFWTNAVHGWQGHVLRTDGGVAMTDSVTLMTEYWRLIDDNSFIHLLRAR